MNDIMNSGNPRKDFSYDPSDGLGAIRSASFLSKVLFFFGLAILISAAGTYTGFQYMIPLFIQNSALMWVFFALELVLVFTARMWSTRRPINYLLFAAFAFITGITIVPLLASIIFEFGGPDLIIKALIATTMTFSAAAIVGFEAAVRLLVLEGF